MPTAYPAAEAITGYSREAFCSLDPWSLFHSEDVELVRERAQRRLAGEAMQAAPERLARREEGEAQSQQDGRRPGPGPGLHG